MLASLHARVGGIPLLLRLTAVASLVIGFVFPLLPFIPGLTFNVSGTTLSWNELWDTGVAFALLMIGPLMLTVGAGILHRRRWVRWLLVVLPVLQLLPFQIVHWLFRAPDPTPSLQSYVVLCVLWVVLVALYVFGRRSVRGYFAVSGAAEHPR